MNTGESAVDVQCKCFSAHRLGEKSENDYNWLHCKVGSGSRRDNFSVVTTYGKPARKQADRRPPSRGRKIEKFRNYADVIRGRDLADGKPSVFDIWAELIEPQGLPQQSTQSAGPSLSFGSELIAQADNNTTTSDSTNERYQKKLLHLCSSV